MVNSLATDQGRRDRSGNSGISRTTFGTPKISELCELAKIVYIVEIEATSAHKTIIICLTIHAVLCVILC